MYIPQEENLIIYQGATFLKSFNFLDIDDNPIDISGWSARMQIRKTYNSSTPMLSLDNEDLEGINITLSDTATIITIYITPAQTASLTDDGLYDIELVDLNGDVLRFMQGSITLSKEVTK